ncbi:MAG: DUF1566 domain-containing protein [Candidatus Electrothrix sp. AR4]|nr:DUF1566 domain-containing protein [Candidatus Electrothrix sp. AR4]
MKRFILLSGLLALMAASIPTTASAEFNLLFLPPILAQPCTSYSDCADECLAEYLTTCPTRCQTSYCSTGDCADPCAVAFSSCINPDPATCCATCDPCAKSGEAGFCENDNACSSCIGFNDTGITWATDPNSACSGTEQDCSQGRDAVSPQDDTDGYAGFSFTSIESGACILDNVTGLAWEAKTAGNVDDVYTWAGARTYVTDTFTVTGCGASYTCRLPTVKELLGLVSWPASQTAGPFIDATFTNTKNNAYWSATETANASSSSSDKAWVVDFSGGYTDNDVIKTGSLYVRAVCTPNP